MANDAVAEWYKRVAATQRSHYLAALRLGRMHYVLGVPVIVLTTLVGTSVFASLSTQPDPRLQITTGIASVVAAVLAALQTFLGLSDRAEKHRLAGAKYGALGRQLEELLSTGADISNLPKIRERLDALAIESPNVPLSIHRQAKISVLQDLMPRSGSNDRAGTA